VESLIAGAIGESVDCNARDIYRRRVRSPSSADGVGGQDAVAVEGQSARLKNSCLCHTADRAEVARRNGNLVAPGVGAGVGVSEGELVRGAEGIIDGGLGRIRGADPAGSVEVRRHLYISRRSGGTAGSGS